MKKGVVRVVFWALLFIAILIGIDKYLYYQTSFYGNGFSNSKNAKKLRLRMDTLQVLRIMGKPDTIIKFEYLFYNYSPPFASSYGIQLGFDTIGILRSIGREDSTFFDSVYYNYDVVSGKLDTSLSENAGKKFGYGK
jgi:hypothetical protein